MLRFIVLFVILIQFVSTSHIGTVNDLPSLNDGDQVAIYLLESSFPYNAPKEAREFAGANFNEYGTVHAGIGIWDLTTGAKFSIEFLSNYYIHSLLPSLNSGYIYWNNTGQLVVTNPINQDEWNDSRHISLTTGVAYKDLLQYLKGNGEQLFNIYQAVNVVYYPNGYIQNFSFINNDKTNEGSFLVQAKDSYDFAYSIINYLNDIGCKMESYLQIYSTAAGYISAVPSSTIVSWEEGQPANLEVYKWFTKLEICYQKYYTALKGFGAGHYIYSLSKCYTGSHAYVYASENSVYNITIYHASVVANSSFVQTNVASLATTLTPFLHRYTYVLPTNQNVSSQPLGSLDVIILFIISCSIVIGIGVCIIPFVWKKKTSIDEMNMMMISADENNNNNNNNNNQSNKSYNNNSTSIFIDSARNSEKQLIPATFNQEYNYNDNHATATILGASRNSSSTDSSSKNNNNNDTNHTTSTTGMMMNRSNSTNGINSNNNTHHTSSQQAPDVTKKSLLKLLRPLNELAKVRETSPRVFDSDIMSHDGNKNNTTNNNSSNHFGGFSINDNDDDLMHNGTKDNGLISLASPFSYMHSMTEHISSAFSPAPNNSSSPSSSLQHNGNFNINNNSNTNSIRNGNYIHDNSSSTSFVSNSATTTQRRISNSPLRIMSSPTTDTTTSGSFSDDISLLNSNKRSGDL